MEGKVVEIVGGKLGKVSGNNVRGHNGWDSRESKKKWEKVRK